MTSGNFSFALKTLLVGLIVFSALFLYSKFGPSIPFSIVNTNKSEFFTANGTGKVQAKPDVAVVSVGFSTSANSVSEAQERANQTINKITKALKDLGISESDLKTTNYDINPEYASNRPEPLPNPEGPLETAANPNSITGYRVNVNLEVKVRDFQKINQAIDLSTANGANQISSLSFRVDDPQKFQNEARSKAIEDAKKNAASLASQTGISLGRIINISETGSSGIQSYLATEALKSAEDSNSQTQIQPGQTEIVSNVTLSYETR